jgi:hypothetical protein
MATLPGARPVLAGYTRNVIPFWRRGIGLAAALFVAMLPVSGAVCAVWCATGMHAATVSGAHSAAASTCHEPVEGQPTLQSTSTHNCAGHDAPVFEAIASAAWTRTALSAPSANQPIGPALPSLMPVRLQPRSGSGPPGRSSPTLARFVLRI